MHRCDFQPRTTAGAVVSPLCQPTNKDIVCGRGRGLDQHPGNKVFRHFIEGVATAYTHESTSKSYKASISYSIRKQIENEGMRFIKKNDTSSVWRELSISEIKLKVGHALRDCKAHRSTYERTLRSKAKKCIAAGLQDQNILGIRLPAHGGKSCTTSSTSPPETSFRRGVDTTTQREGALCAIISRNSKSIGIEDKRGPYSLDCNQDTMDDFSSIQESFLRDSLNVYADPLSVTPNITDCIPAPPASVLSMIEEESQYDAYSGLIDVLVEMCCVDDLLSQFGSTHNY